VPLRFARRGENRQKPTPAARLAAWTVYAAVVLPVLVPFGWLDHWPGWAVYAPSAERVRLFAPWQDDRGLTNLVRDGQRKGPSLSSPLPMARWSLAALSAPIPPDERFQVGVALAVTERADKDGEGMLAIETRANRFTGKRDMTYLSGIQEIRDYADSFWPNTRPRKIGGW